MKASQAAAARDHFAAVFGDHGACGLLILRQHVFDREVARRSAFRILPRAPAIRQGRPGGSASF
jgi:hypothetical protein